MKITLLLEGTYPYVQGGVSAWTDTLIRSLPGCEFAIVYLGVTKKQTTTYQYALPANVTHVREIYLHEQETPRSPLRGWRRRERAEMVQFLQTGAWPSAGTLHRVRSLRHTPTAEAIVASDWAWQAALEVYRTLPEPPALIDFIWNWRAMWLPLLRLMRAPLPEGEVLHAPSTGYAGWLGSLYHRLCGQPLIVTEHGIYTREREEEIVRADWVPLALKGWWTDFFARLAQVSYDSASYITTLSVVNQQAQLRFGAPRSKMRLIPNGIDPARYADVLPQRGEPFVVGAILRVVPIKDVKTLLHAMAIVCRHRPDARLLLIGPQQEDPAYFQECLALIASLGIGAAVEWTGAVDVLTYLPQLSCVVLTSVSEGQPLVMLETMAAGLPLVVTDVGGCRELIEGVGDDPWGACGFVTKLMAPDETAACLLQLARDPALCAEMGQNGRARVRTFYHLQNVIAAYHALYEQAVSR